jgi:hypothetical protein
MEKRCPGLSENHTEFQLPDSLAQTKWTDGQVILMTDVIKGFQKFWVHDSTSCPISKNIASALNLDEATYSFMLIAYLQKIIKSLAKIHHQYAEGRGAVDICIIYQNFKYLIETKLYDSSTYNEDIIQLSDYLNTSGEKEGWLVIFNRDFDTSYEDRIYFKIENYNDKIINVLGC